MSIIYKILGIFARINEYLSRQSVNLIQINWILIGFSFVGFAAALGNYFESVAMNKTPQVISIEDIATSYEHNKRYVTVKGIYDPHFGIEYGTKSKGSTEINVTHIFIPIIESKQDKNTKQNTTFGVYVKHDKDFQIAKPKDAVEVTGIINHLYYTVETELVKMKDTKGINPNFSIDPNETPPSTSWAIVMLLVSSFFLFGFTWIRRYKIVQTNREKISVSSTQMEQFSTFADETSEQAQQFVDGELTGKMFFKRGGNRNFCFIPVRVNFLEDGSILCASNIDASSTFFGIRTKKRKGIWTVAFQKGEVLDVKNIYQYFGFKRYPGIQIKFSSSSENKNLLLAFKTKELHKNAISKILYLKS
ncbi:MAG: hypothetical protein AAF518_29145 [Spirochaetota bacterium]